MIARVNLSGVKIFVVGAIVIFFAASSLYGTRYRPFVDDIKACLKSVICAWFVSVAFAYFMRHRIVINISIGFVMILPAVIAVRYILRRVICKIRGVAINAADIASEFFTESINASPFTLRKVRNFFEDDTAKKGKPVSREQVLEKIRDIKNRIIERKNHDE